MNQEDNRKINMDPQLSGSHQKVFDRVCEQPVPHNLQWREVRSMLGAMSDAELIEDKNGTLKMTRNNQTLILHRPRGKDLAGKKELLQVRHFLERSSMPQPMPIASGVRLLVVIDHREARVYQTESHGEVPQRIKPYDPFGFDRDLRYNQDDSNGQRKPELKPFYDAVAKTLKGASQILVFGNGTGESSAMVHLLATLKSDHPDIAENIVGTIAVDEHHLTENQLLAKAREFFVKV